METMTQTPMKPVLIERISDDIKDLKKGDVENQKTLFSGRALQDLVRYGLIDFSDVNDRKYYTEADDSSASATHLIDLNLVIDAATRSFKANTYTNGPQGVTAAGFVYVLRVLANGALTWVDTTHGNQNIDSDKDKTTYPRDSNQTFSTGTNPQVTGEDNDPTVKFLRQFFFQVGTGDEIDNESYTRSAVWSPTLNNNAGGWLWSDWTAVSGRKLRILVATESAAAVIRAPSDGTTASALARDVIYELHCPVGEIRLPDPVNYRATTTIAFEQYPDPTGQALMATKISFSDPLTGQNNVITAVPSCDRNTANVDRVYDDGVGASMYTFEVVHLPSSEVTAVTTIPSTEKCKTWELVVDAEETDYLSGMAEMLDMHTDRVLGDVLQYSARKYLVDGVPEVTGSTTTQSNTENLTMIRAFTFCGYAKIRLNKVTSLLDSDWSLTVERIDASASAAYTKVDLTTETAPNPYQVYWVLKGNQYVLAENDGHPVDENNTPTWSAGVDYYTISTTNGNVTTNTILSITGANLTTGVEKDFYGFFYRNQLIRITVHPGANGHIHARDTGNIFCTIGFYPDPHDTYIQKIHLNRFAYTAAQLERMKAAGEYPKDLGEDPDDFPIASKALIDAYAYLAKRLQAKGLLFGVIDKVGVVGPGSDLNSIDNIKSSGMYWVTPSSITGFPTGSTLTTGGHLIVIDNTRTTNDIIHEEATELATTSSNYRTITAGTAGTQIFTQLVGSTSFNVWTRSWTVASGTTTWTPWIKVRFDKFYVDKTASQVATVIDADTIKQYLLQGEPCIKVGGDGGATATVTLPSPSAYPAGTCMQLELIKGSCTVKFAIGTEQYEYTETWAGSTGDINLIKLETDGTMWYRLAVAACGVSNITFDDDDDTSAS